MLITEEMLKYPEELEDRVSKYLEYPEKQPSKFVIQIHLRGPNLTKLTDTQKKALSNASVSDIQHPSSEVLKEAISASRGVSNHLDFRWGITSKSGGIKYLVGRTIVGLTWPGKLGILDNVPAKGYRAEEKCMVPDIKEVLIDGEWIGPDEDYDIDDVDGIITEGISPWCDEWRSSESLSVESLARQPASWLTVKGYQGPGKVGATREGGGLFIIGETGQVIVGSLKPYFQEYFLKGTKGIFPDWTKVVVRGIKVGKWAPGTREAIKGEQEFLWRIMVAKDQKPYAISSRARRKNWVPPKGITPFPEEWAKKNWPKDYDKWKQYVKEQWKEQPKGTEKESMASARFVLHENSWKGQEVIRRMRLRRYYLRIVDKSGGPRSWEMDENPLDVKRTAAYSEGRVPSKWATFKGEIKPGQKYNPHKKISTYMDILDSGTVSYNPVTEDGKEIIELVFKGKKLKGGYVLVQEEKGSNMYVLQPSSAQSLAQHSFVLDRHEIFSDGKTMTHWDIRISNSDIDEWNLVRNPLQASKGNEIKAIHKKCRDPKWMAIEGRVKVGSLDTRVTRLDKGTVDILEYSPEFSSFIFNGEDLKGLWVSKDDLSSPGKNSKVFIKSRLPTPDVESDQ